MQNLHCGMRLLAVTAFLLVAQATHAAELRMRLVWDGDLPELERIDNPFNLDCRDVDLNADRQFVDSETMGIRDLVVHVEPPRKDRRTWSQPPRNKTVPVAVKDCRIHPHIVVAQAGDTIVVAEHADSVGHNLNFPFFANGAFCGIRPPNADFTLEVPKPEPGAIPIQCNIHPWEKAYLFVLEHEFIGVSDKQGNLTIRGLPDAAEVPIRFFHEHGAIESVRIDDQRRLLDKGRLTLALSGPVTDLGEVVIDADSFAKRGADTK